MPCTPSKPGKAIFTIPNLLSCLRLVLLPVAVALYWNAHSAKMYLAAALVMGVSSLTDLLDGKIARRFNQVSELGVFLDPLADKLTLCVMVFCVALRTILDGTGGVFIGLLAGLLAAKDIFMAVACGVMLRHNRRKFSGSLMVGKVCTAYLYVVLFLMLLSPCTADLWGLAMPAALQNLLILIGLVLMLMTWYAYLKAFAALWRLPAEAGAARKGGD